MISVRHEMCIRDRDFTDLELLEEAEKREDLLAIFEAVSEMLVQHRYESQSKIAFFLNQVEEGHLEEQLQDVAIVVDGFTRFSAEEEALDVYKRQGLSSKTQWLSGLYYADFISFYSPTQLCGGGTTKSNSNE